MSGHMKSFCFQRADIESITIRQNTIELTAVPAEPVTLIENGAECGLDGGDVSADANITAQLCLNIRRAGQVICVDVTFQDAIYRQALCMTNSINLSAEAVVKVPEA